MRLGYAFKRTTDLSEFWLLDRAEKAGLEVSFRHYRRTHDSPVAPMFSARHIRQTWDVAPAVKGGLTTALVMKQGKVLAHGCAHCSNSDNFCKATGRLIALRRALGGALA